MVRVLRAGSVAVALFAVLLGAGPRLVRADELADLQENNLLLEQHVERLTQTQAVRPDTDAGYLSFNSQRVSLATASGTGGSFPRSFRIPGSDTSIRVGGFIHEILDYWFTGGPVNASPQTTLLGANGQAQVVPLDVHGQVVRGVVQARTHSIAAATGCSRRARSSQD